MTRLVLILACLAALATSSIAGQEKPKNEQAAKKAWKIMRDTSTNDCIVMKMTASHPGYPDLLGSYETQEQAIAALERFKKEDDPNKVGFEKCTNK